MSHNVEGPTRPIPKWLVSARNGLYVENGVAPSLWRPFGVHHARQVGSAVTACGLPAFGWQLFWDLPFPSHVDAACVECRVVVLRSDFSMVG